MISKQILVTVLITAMAVVIVLQRCGSGYDKGDSKPDTTFVSDTSYRPQPTVQVPVYQPIIVESKQPVYIPQQYQPATDQSELLKQYQDLVNKLLSTNTYKDSITLRDSAGHRVGVVNLHDEVSENEIKRRNPSYQLSFPVITNTTTITRPYIPTRQLYLGGELSGNRKELLNTAWAGLIYKDRKDRVFTVKVGTDINLQPSIALGTYLKIKFK